MKVETASTTYRRCCRRWKSSVEHSGVRIRPRTNYWRPNMSRKGCAADVAQNQLSTRKLSIQRGLARLSVSNDRGAVVVRQGACGDRRTSRNRHVVVVPLQL